MGMREWERRRGGREEREGIKATRTCKNGDRRG